MAAATTGLAGLLLAGCAVPEGIDGDLVGGWAAMPGPVAFVPEVGTCHLGDYQPTGALADYDPVDCTRPHVTETVHVGAFTGEAGERDAPPEAGSSTWRRAYAECDEAATEYLGADFRHGRLWLGVTVPSPEAWTGGSRWFRCEVVEFEDVILFGRIRRDSLAGALAEDSSLRLGCFDVTTAEDDEEQIERMAPIGCDEPHHAEFVGVWRAPDGPYLAGDNAQAANQVHQGCREQVAEYVDVPVDGDLPFRTGTIADWMDEVDWTNGDRGFRCYLWLSGEEITGSLKGAGTSGLPVREA
jgi:hypothetical protein